ncbi:MAG: general secretion pathway protein GspE [Desulfuromonadales bacterium]|nr:general secretion pathway protein GspE [Desulfuromonadales bacterium]NIR32964.1 general secretion pathway protein GspE [Desulfuromonadales bacterium]NIS40522.1 general secretion pathway protein GspE [Desulfuromonadales bacterium]
MAIKLGEFLVREGLVTEDDLEEALKYQVIYGGKLGTNLIEMGLVEEGDIAKALSKKLGIPYVPPQKLENIPRDLLDTIPTEIAEKYRVLPVARENKKLFLAMTDPADLHAIDEISFRTGYIVKPVLTPELRLVLALEQYYGIDREMRYIPLDKRVTTARKKAKKTPSPESEQTPQATPDEEEEFIEIPGVETAEEIEEAEPLEEIEELAAAEVVEEVAEADIVEEAYTLDVISRLLADAGDREDIADIIIGYLGQEFHRGAIFQVRGSTISGWRGMVNGTNSERFPQIDIGLDEPSVLKTVVENRSYYLGAISRTEANDRVFQGLGGYLAPTALLVPIQILGRVVGILYVDAESVDLSERTVDLQTLAAKASMAFEILILKKKILML